MRALTLWQPMAWAVAHAGKTIENRPRRAPSTVVGGLLAIHAGLKVYDPWITAMQSGRFGDAALDCPDFDDTVRGAVVAVAHLQGCVESREAAERFGHNSGWWMGPWGLLLRDVRTLEHPVLCRGMQGYWNLPAEVAAQVEAQL